jgi:hypothetical protein
MNLFLALVDKRDRPDGFVGEREGVLAGPRFAALTAIVLGRQDLVTAAEHLGEVAPLAGAATGAMQGNRPPAAYRPRRVHCIDVHGRVPLASGCSVVAAKPAVGRCLASHRTDDL